MFAKRLLQAVQHQHQHQPQPQVPRGYVESSDFDMRISVHHGIPSTASLLAFDPIQRLLAIATLDGRIKVIGGDGIEGLLISPTRSPYKYIEFLQNQGFLVSISNDNEFQVWNLENRHLVCCVQWESNVTAFSVINGSNFMYVGNEYGTMHVMKYDADSGKLLQLPYHISEKSLHEIAGFSLPNYQPIVGVLPQPCSSGDRVLIVYENGLILLWDISEAQILFVGGGKDLQLKDEVVNSPNKHTGNLQDDISQQLLEDKEISSLCWASSDGSILAVGYIDGDILLWNTSYTASAKGQDAGLSCKNVVRLQLSSAERRLPVIVLQWSIADKSRNNCDGLLFIYGGDEIGSEEVLTVLSLEWSSGMEAVKCVGRVDLTLTGSFADMILLPKAGATGVKFKADLFVLTSPGQLQFYDDASLSTLISQQERKPSVSAYAVEFPSVIPTADPPITVAKLIVPTGRNSSNALAEIMSAMKQGSTETLASNTKWPLTGGVPSELFITENNGFERLYIGGYKDGSVRIWNATYPILSHMFLLEGEVPGIKVAGSSAPVSKLDFCFVTLTLAVGNECGLVRLYTLKGCSDTSFHFISETKHEVHNLPQEKRPYCKAVFCLINSSIQVLRFAKSGAKLVVGFECGRVAVLDMSSLSVVFFKDCISGSTSPLISIVWKEFSSIHCTAKSPKHSETKTSVNHMEEIMFILTKDANVNVIDGGNGNPISSRPFHLKKEVVPISMYVLEVGMSSIEKVPIHHVKNTVSENVAVSDSTLTGSTLNEMEHQSIGSAYNGEELLNSLVLLCCENALRLYSTKSVLQGNGITIRKVKLAKPCCWTTMFMKDDKVCGLMLLYQTGLIEIRSLPDLEVVKESTLMSILRWNFKANMDKMLSSSDNGQIALVNGCELAFISLLAGENGFRIPESIPCLHDKVLAAAADAAFSVPLNQKKKQGVTPGILGGIVKGFKGGKASSDADFSSTSTSDHTHLEAIFLKVPILDSSPTITRSQEVVAPSLTATDKHEDLELDIDDIEIDEPLPVSSSASSHKVKNKNKEKATEREKLFEGGTEDSKPRLRTREEIIAKYKKAGDDTSSVAANARNKLVERQEKLEKISKRTEDLQNGAEDFASLANELVKTMENRKWWHI